MLIKLCDKCYVAHDQISEIKISDYGNVTVRTKDGIGHPVPNDYGQQGYQTLDRLVQLINSASETFDG